MKICFILERGVPPRQNPVIMEAIAQLEHGGAKVSMMYPEEELFRLDNMSIEADFYLLKSDTELSLSIATVLAALGAKVVNRVAACLTAKDKTLAAATLFHAGIPTPSSYVAYHPQQFDKQINHSPLIFKPNRGYHGAGIKIVGDPTNIPDCQDFPDMVFVQDYLADARKDLKIFAIADKIFGVRKTFSTNSFLHTGEPVSLTPEMEETARRCGQAFGLDLYGLDIAETPEADYVVDVNYFPGYRGVPDAATHLVNYIIGAARA